MTKPSLLLVDDDFAHRNMLSLMLKSWGYQVEEADDGDKALKLASQQVFDVVLTDIRMARVDGIATLQGILELNPAIPILIMTAYSSVETAVCALRLGAYDYLNKPLDFEHLKQVLAKAVEHTRLHKENASLHGKLNQDTVKMIGNSPKIKELIRLVEMVGPSEATVLISGESGTGKELVARAVQNLSQRANKAFIALNCAALTESLLESELFGHEKGAFTGAEKMRDGRFKQADGGILFLDEIGELPLSLQSKFLRALQQGEIQRVGGDKTIKVDVRIIAATNVDLKSAILAGKFREDLYYRLNVINIEVPPLRERKEDIALLATHFLERFCLLNRKKISGLTPQAMDILLRYNWPGNVRELENTIERAVILCSGDYVRPEELPKQILQPEISSKSEAHEGLEGIEQQAILEILSECSNNKSEAARRLGITRATLHNKLKKYGLS